MKTIVYQGIKGSFSDMTAVKEFGLKNHFQGLDTFREVFEWVYVGKADCAVIPIENSLIGSIYENYDLLSAYEMQISGEIYTKIEHSLLTIATSHEPVEEQLKRIKKVLSHPKALEQCERFFQSHPWIEAVVFKDTAAAAAKIAQEKDPTCAAIASKYAKELYGLEILKKGIQDDLKNTTRFVTIVKKGKQNGLINKCSLLLQLKHVPGALADVLKRCADQSLNVTKIESRPLPKTPFEYRFYIDCEWDGKTREEIEYFLEKLVPHVLRVTILGFYKRGDHG